METEAQHMIEKRDAATVARKAGICSRYLCGGGCAVRVNVHKEAKRKTAHIPVTRQAPRGLAKC